MHKIDWALEFEKRNVSLKDHYGIFYILDKMMMDYAPVKFNDDYIDKIVYKCVELYPSTRKGFIDFIKCVFTDWMYKKENETDVSCSHFGPIAIDDWAKLPQQYRECYKSKLHESRSEKISNILNSAKSLEYKLWKSIENTSEKENKVKIIHYFNQTIKVLMDELTSMEQELPDLDLGLGKRWNEINMDKATDKERFKSSKIECFEKLEDSSDENISEKETEKETEKEKHSVKELSDWDQKSNFDEVSSREFIPLEVSLPMKFYLPKGFSKRDFERFYMSLGVTREKLLESIADEIVISYKDSIKKTLGFCADII